MFSSMLRTALRTLRKRPGYAFLNGFGLSLGLACFLLIGVFVANELRYDRHNDDAERIARVGLSGYPPSGGGDHFAIVGPPVAPVLRQEFPEVESVVRFSQATPAVSVGDESFDPDEIWIAEPELFDVFTMPVIDGASEGLLEEPRTVVLTRSTAERFFPNERAIGKAVVLDDTLQAFVTAVIEDEPQTSHMHPDMLISWSTYNDASLDDGTGWLSLGYYTYVKLAPGNTVEAFDAKIRDLPMEKNAEQMQAMGFRAELVAEPLLDIYLHSTRSAQLDEVGDITQVWIFGAVALFVLILAIINFTNLSTARSMERAREVGIRKVVGSSRGALVAQFLGESLVMGTAAFVLSIGLVAAGLPLLNTMAGKEILLSQMLAVTNLLPLLGVALLAGLLGGLYPAVVMSGFDSTTVLKGTFHARGPGAWLRKGLVAFQFAISIALLAGTSIVMRQLDFMREQDLGFDEDRMLVVNLQNVPGDQLAGRGETLKSVFGELGGVADASTSGSIPGRGSGRILFGAEGVDPTDIRSANFLAVGTKYFQNYGIDIVEGRGYSPDFPADAQESIVLSESAVDYLGWGSPQEALGKWVSFGGNARRTVIGVAADYHHSSLKEAIEPMLFVNFPQALGYLSLRLSGGEIRAAREQVESEWADMFPGTTLDAFFLDDDFNRQYETEERLRGLFSIFAVLAVVIACLGLFGLAAFTAQQRTKEIGVRKVMGASVTGIVALLSREFALLVGVGFLIAVPLAAYGMNMWLDSFPYSAGLGVAPFLIAGGGALVIALGSVSYQAIRAALADPVRSLRYE